jgi:4-amino-4-deoxy-L-arabinose transferase-like glycosyltransferase
VRARIRRVPLPLVVLVALAALQAVGWAIATAPFEGPDESAHFSYVQNLVERGRAPAFDRGDGTISTETNAALEQGTLRAQPDLPDIKPSSSSADERAWRAYERTLPDSARDNAGGPNAVAKNPPLYYLYESLAYRAARGLPLFDLVFAMRMANVLLLVGTVLFAWLAAGELFVEGFKRTAATAFVALQPMLVFLGGVINPDTLLALAYTAFAFAGLRMLRRGPSFWRVTGALAAVVAAVFTQGRGLPLIPAVVILLALAFWRHRPVRMRALAGVGAGAALAGAALAVYNLTLAASSGAYGGEIAFRSSKGFSLWEYVSQTWQFYLPKLPGMRPMLGPHYGVRQLWVETFWGTFGSLDVHLSPQMYDVVSAAMLCLVVAVPVALFVRRREVRWDAVAFLGITALGLVLFLHLASYRNLLGTDDPLLVGRYLLPLVLPMGAAAVFVLHLLPRRQAIPGVAILLALEAFLGLTGIGLSLVRFYG